MFTRHCFALIVVICLLHLSSQNQVKRYTGDKVFRLYPMNDKQFDFVRQFLNAPGGEFDFWAQPSGVGRPADLHVAAESVQSFSLMMESAKIPFHTLVEDVQEIIDDVEAKDAALGKNKNSIVGTFPSYNDTMTWISSLCGSHPDMASCGSFGMSYESRSMNYIKLGTASSGSQKKKIFIEGTVHAREWLGTATVVHMIDRLITTYNSDPTAKRMMDTFDWYFIPISNPDGYEYSRNSERLWRKTRSTNAGSFCRGTDPNRNWDFRWGSTGGSSTNPCSDTYRGAEAFSEPEMKSIADFLLENKDNTHAYFSIHCYSQYWLIPYGVGALPDDFDELDRVGKIGTKALEAVNSKSWEVGNVIDLLYAAAGISIDWTKGVAGMKYSYCLELRPPSGSLSGFIVSASEIEPSGQEVWAGLVAAIDAIPL